ncbi:MAG: glutamine amidotransferase-related protein, partial [Candidatus Bipolaricaulota bacterium]
MDKLLVLDFGGQYSHLIARRIREVGVYSEVLNPDRDDLLEISELEEIKGLVLSGGAFSVYDEGAPECSEEVLELACPVLGICYGHQLLAQLVGGEVSPGESAEYGNTDLTIRRHNHLLSGLEETETVWMNHKDT